jgi:hypothetical protein
MNLERALCNMQDDDDEVPQAPSVTGSVRLDDFFEKRDHGIQEADADETVVELPLGKRLKVSKQRIQACRTPDQLKALDRLLYQEAGLNPQDFGL